MLWQKDRRVDSGGRWECRAKRRQYNKRRTDPAVRDELNARRRAEWQEPNGGYVRWRRRVLAQQRTQITERLTALEQEAQQLAES